MTVPPSMFDRIGGEVPLRRIIDDFVERVFKDVMIGFFFARAEKQRIKDKEYEFAARHLGAPVEYTGRPLPTAHAPHHITGGHFMRRLQILRETLADHRLPDDIVEHWIDHNNGLRSAITDYSGSDCQDVESGQRQQRRAERRTAGQRTAEQSGPDGPEELSVNRKSEDKDEAKRVPPKRDASVSEINAYLEESAKRTRRRLTLATSNEEEGEVETTERSLPLASKPKPTAAERSLPIAKPDKKKEPRDG